MRPFARAHALMSALAAAIMNSAAVDGMAQIAKARQAAAGYKSRGKGGARAHRPTGIAGVRRAARKARNVKANRRAHK